MMLTCKAADEKPEHALMFTFELAAGLPQSGTCYVSLLHRVLLLAVLASLTP
jgi:hypothetical protein